MQVFRHIQSLRDALDVERKQALSIGFVPTMGNLHLGHLALIALAKKHCDIVVASIFVNRLQFGLNEDWDQYPRTFEQDCQQLIQAGCHYLFFPEETEMYPNGMDAQARVIVPSMTDVLCGASRPGHFEGVTTVVSKLFHIIEPDTAVFGIKDYQQLAIIRRMVEDLCLPVEIIAGDIVRESDGLAMSSRNHFLQTQERNTACQLYLSLQWVKQAISHGRRDYDLLEEEAKLQITQAGFRVDYLQICNSHTLMPAASDDTHLTILGAMYTSAARLIDNISLSIH